MEILTQVDKRGNVLGKCSYNQAHKKGIRHKTVHVLLFDFHGRVLLTQRCNGKFTTSAGGHVKYGENPEDAAYRELNEELRIREKLRFVGSFVNDTRPGNKEHVDLFIGNYSGVVLLNSESIDYKYVSVRDLINDIRCNSSNYTGTLKNIYRNDKSIFPAGL